MSDDATTSPQVAASLAGTIVGSYRMVSELGAGGMGAVWLAEHTLLGSRAAIKVLRPELSQNAGIVKRFFDEARAASRIHHPGIVTVLDFGWQAENAFLVMEHLTGETLTRAIVRDRIAPRRALALIRQCAVAMAAAHATDIVHRDLKPDNLFLITDAVGEERIKILDFGIAKLVGEPGTHAATQTGLIMGTPAYMSPEQCRGAGRVDHRTDIYALGCVLFHMLTGRPPFVADTPGDLIACHLTMPAPVPSAHARGISPEIDTVVARCLAKVADHRIATMVELVAAIDGALASPSLPPQPLARAVSEPIASPTMPTKATGAVPVPTTMRSSTGELSEHPHRPWRGGAIVAALVLIGAVLTLVAIAKRGGGDHAAAPSSTSMDAGVLAPPDATTATTATTTPADAAAAPPGDAPAATARPDAGSTPQRPRRPRPPDRGSGSGSAYDQYDQR